MIQKCTIIGCGKVGKTFSMLFQRIPQFCHVAMIVSRSFPKQKLLENVASGDLVDNEITQKVRFDDLKILQGIIALTVPDDAIRSTSEKLSNQCVVRPGTVVFHTSGVHTSSALTDLKSKGAFIASIHPAFSFQGDCTSPDALRDVVCAIEGDEEALRVLVPIFKGLGAKILTIDPKFKEMYHAGCCVASNYLVGLYALAENILCSAGLPLDTISSVLVPLMRSSLDNLAHKKPSEALTGPITRNDITTIQLHTEHLSEEHLRYYKFLGCLLIDQANLPNREVIQKILNS